MVFNYRLIIFLLLLSSSATGQSISRTYIGSPSGMEYNTRIGGYQVTKWMKVPRILYTLPASDSVGGGQIAFDSANTRTMWYHNGVNWIQMGAGGGGSGTVTNVSTGFGMLGGPITTTGTVRVDSNAVLTVARGYKVADSVAGSRVPYTGATQTVDLGNQNLITDTITGTGSGGLHLHGSASNSGIEIANFGQVRMDYYPIANSGDSVLTTNSNGYIQVYNLRGNYQKLSDTSTWDATKSYVNALVIDTTALSNRINQKQNYTDTSTWDATRSWTLGQIPSVSGYATTSSVADSVSGRVKYSDTVTLIGTQYQIDTTAFNALTRINTKGSGTVTSVGSGFGLTGGAITTTGTLRVDTANVPTQYRVDTTAFNALTRINTKGTVSSVALANGFGLSVSGSPITGTGTITATVDTTKVATKADVNAKGSGTVTSIQIVAGTGVSITPTTAVTTSGTYTISATGATGVQSITSTGSTAIISGTTTVNLEVDTTHPFTFTGNNTFTRDITVDSITIGTKNGLSTNALFGRNAGAGLISTSSQNVFMGDGAGQAYATATTGNTAIGFNAGNKITTGTAWVYVGRLSGANTSTSVNGCTAVGNGTLNYSTGDNNTAIGNLCMGKTSAWNGISNTGVGWNTGNALTSGSSNSWLGAGAANALTSGSSNTFVGVNSGNVISSGSQNTIIGAFTGNSGGLDIRTLSNRVVLSDGGANIRAYHNGTNWLFGTVTDGSTGILQLSGNLGLNTAGNKINIATGSNASVGTATLVAGTIEVNTTAVTASSIIMLTGVSTGAPPCATCGDLSVGTITAGTKFVINSSLATDTRVVQYWIIN